MTLTVLAEDAARFFTASGWRQFFLDEQLLISPPVTSLAELCNVSPSTLNGTSFLALFKASSREELRLRLTKSDSDLPQAITSLAMVLQSDHYSQDQPVEIMLYRQPGQAPSPDYVGFIRLLPKTIIDFSTKYGFQHKNGQNNQFAALAQLTHRLPAILDLQMLLNHVLESLSQALKYKYTAIYLLDDHETSLIMQAVSEVDINTILPDQLRLKTDHQTVVGQVAVDAQPLRIDHLSHHQYRRPDYLPFVPKSEVAIPLIFAGQVQGVLDVKSDRSAHYTDDDLDFLQAVANQLAVALENIRLVEERDRHIAELAVFNQIGMAIVGRQDLESMLSGILRWVSALFQVEGVSLMLLEEDGLHFAVALGTAAEEIKSFVLKPGQGIAWSVVDTRQTIRVDQVEQDPRHFSAIDSAIDFKTRSLLAVPVQIQDRALGVIEVMNRLDGHPFSRDNEATLEFIASAIAVVIENARLFQETQKQLAALTTLTEASEVITKAPDLDHLLFLVLDLALSIINAQAGAIILTDNSISGLQVKAARGFEQEKLDLFNRLNLSQYVGIWGETYRTKQFIEIKNAATDPRVFTSPEVAWIFPNSFTSVPLLSQEDCIGLIILHAVSEDNDTRALLKAVADMAAVAIDKARLFKETNQWLAEVLTLYTLADQLTKVLDLNPVTESSVSILQHALDCDNCCLFLTEQAGAADAEKLILKASSGRYERNRQSLELEYITRLVNQRVQQPQSIYIDNVTKPHPAGLSLPEVIDIDGASHTELQIRSLLIVPLIAKDELLGAITIDDTRPNAFSQSENRLLTIAAAQISTAIENIQLYDDLEHRAVELELALEEVREVNRLKSEFVQNVSHELRTPLTFVTAYVELILEGSLGDISAEIRDKLEIVSEKTKTVTRLVEDVVSLQKIEAGNLNLELTTPHQLVTRAIYGAIASAAEQNIKIVPNGRPDLPPVHADIGRIEQVFDNLVANAIKFSPPGGRINLITQQIGDYIKFSVQDFGIGIPPDKLDKIFERFYQVDGSTTRRYRGTGLGLAIVKQIVEAHGGQVSVQSILNKSTVFSFTLPISKGEVKFEPA